MRRIILPFLLSAISFSALAQKQDVIEISADKSIAKISPSMWGIFFEDINFAADGGLYAEMIKNRSFEFANPLMGWKTTGKGKLLIVNQSATESNNPRYVKVGVDNQDFSLINEGFRGMGFKENAVYRFSVNAQLLSNSKPKIAIQLVAADGKVISEKEVPEISSVWKNYQIEIKSIKTELKGIFRIVFKGSGTVNLDMISLFPVDTWKGRPAGLRKDLVQRIADLKPGFLRFPGGCIVEGRDLANRYQWKETVGSLNDRKVMINRWNTEFAHRSAPDYFQSFGLGFYEYFLLAEDIGAKALPILNCGMACQYNTAEVVANTQLDPYIQDAVDLIEFANGDVNSKWGKLRAEMGHPKPFNLDRIGVGNEQWGEQYLEKYKLFEAVLKAKYPNVKLIGAAGPSASGESFDYAWTNFKSTGVDFIDEHYYMAPDWFLKNASRYDNYDRKGPKIFAGEYAAHDKEGKFAESKNTWFSALTEAAFMTGLERNADIVQMSSYAPLLAHVDAWQWRPDLIWFDNLSTVATPNYWVQQFYANFKGTDVVEILSDKKKITGQNGIYANAVVDKEKKQLIIKLVNTSNVALVKSVMVNAKNKVSGNAEVYQLQNDNLAEANSIEKPDVIKPLKSTLKINNNKLSVKMPAYSFMVLVLNFKSVN